MLMPFHNPVRLAEDIAVVDVISDGRLEVGVGVGYKVEEYSWTLPPGLPPLWAQTHLELFASKVIPAFR